MKKYTKLTTKEKQELEDKILNRAQELWKKNFPNSDATDVNKLRYFSRQGYLQNQVMEDAVHNFFKRKGLWHDGKTTLAERKKQLIQRKKEYGQRIAEIRKAKIKDMNDIIKRAEEKKKGLMQIPEKLRSKFNVKKQEILDTLNEELQRIYDTFTQTLKNDLQATVDHTINRIRERGNNMIQNSMEQVDMLYKNIKAQVRSQTEEYSAELEAELSILEYEEQDNVLIDQYTTEIKDINVELNDLEDTEVIEDDDLEEKTVAELRDMTENIGIELPSSYVTKDDLIGMIREV